MIVIVTGGRDFSAASVVNAALDMLHAQTPIAFLAHGACGVTVGERMRWSRMRGADAYADDWARARSVEVVRYPVDHAKDGPWPAAGPKRNARMLRDPLSSNVARASAGLDPFRILVVAFLGGRGTQGCIDQALALGLRVWRIHGTGPWHSETIEPK